MRNRIVALALGAIVVTGAGLAFAANGSLKQVKESRFVQYPNPETVDVVCPGSNGHISSGGWETEFDLPSGTGKNMFAHAAFPHGEDADEWSASGHNRFVGEQSKLTSYGYCFNGPEPEIVESTTVVPAFDGDGSVTNGETGCPEGTTLIGGGYRISPDVDMQSLVHIEQISGSSNTYQVSVLNEKDEAVDLTVYAVCGKGKKPKAVSERVNIKENKRKSVTAKCPNNKDFVFGGVGAETFPDYGVWVTAHKKDGNGMTAEGVNLGIPPFNKNAILTVSAYCR